jgi:DNA-binding response OmpR family regulator
LEEIITMALKKVLMIDDDEHLETPFRIFLERFENVEFHTSDRGDSGLQLAKELKPDLIILDNRMPGMTGLQVARRLRKDKSTRNIPIVMISALQIPDEDIEELRNTIDDYLRKPINPNQLQELVEKYL